MGPEQGISEGDDLGIGTSSTGNTVSMSPSSSCWCGNRALDNFSADYLHCGACETLVAASIPEPEKLLVRDDELDYYGKHYFDTVAELHGLPALNDRARTDLPERCLHWLRNLLRYCCPPARVLELGSAHGGYVAMMRWAGFDATGLDLSPQIVGEARRRFDVPILEGPIESQNIDAESLDAIVLMDVLEHLGNPKETMRQCLNLLKPGGLIFLQTPRYREGKSFEQMQKAEDPFLQMLMPDQHLYLFSNSSVKQLFRELGFTQVNFEPAIFSSYDMALVAGRIVPVAKPEAEIVHCLESLPTGRLILALHDLDLQYKDLTVRHANAEVDRAERLENALNLEKLLAEQTAGYYANSASQQAAIDDLTKRLKESEADRAVRLANTRSLEALLAEQAAAYSADRVAQQAAIDGLAKRLEQSEADRAVRLANILALEALLAEQAAAYSADRTAQQAAIGDLTNRLKESEADRDVRLANILSLETLLAEQAASYSADRVAQRAGIDNLTNRLMESEADRAVRLANTLALEALLAEQAASYSADRVAQQAGIDNLTNRLKESEADRDVRLANILSLETLLAEQAASYSADRVAQRAGIDNLTNRLMESEADRAARLENMLALETKLAARAAELDRLSVISADQRAQITQQNDQLQIQSGNLREMSLSLERARRDFSTKSEALSAMCNDLRKENQDKNQLIESTNLRLSEIDQLLGRVRQSQVTRLLRTVRLWGWVDGQKVRSESRPSPVQKPGNELRKVVIDLTPVLPGGGNGGAKVMTLELIRQLCRISPECDFVLLTLQRSHDELAALDGHNVRRFCMNPPNGVVLLAAGESVVRQLGADLLFCPFTAPFYFDPGVPTVCVVYDLQHAFYPEFFDVTEIQERDRNLAKAVQSASKIVCISEFVRQTLLEKTRASPGQAETIHILLPRRLASPSPSQIAFVLNSLHLVSAEFLLYPANFWPHKNHELLLSAFGIYLAGHPESTLRLVLTGAPGPQQEFLEDAVRRMGLSERVSFPGYLPETELSALLHSCMAVIFPSLFEGFGMPLLEAMAAGRPVLCSEMTCLPEVAGDAALFFDPRKPLEIADAIARVVNDPDLRRDLAAKGTKRLNAFGGPEDMAAQYLAVFRGAVQNAKEAAPGLYGVFEDGWLGERFTVELGNGANGRLVQVALELPEWVSTSVSIRVESVSAPSQTYHLAPGEAIVIHRSAESEACSIDLFCSPAFQPSQRGLGDDSRFLTCRLQHAEILSSERITETILNVHHGA